MSSAPRVISRNPIAVRLLLAAAGVAAAALANHLASRRKGQCHPPAGKFVETDGVRLHCLDHGDEHAASIPIVLLHGNGAMSDDFVISGLVEALACDLRVPVFDQPGFGHSQRPRPRPRKTAWTASA